MRAAVLFPLLAGCFPSFDNLDFFADPTFAGDGRRIFYSTSLCEQAGLIGQDCWIPEEPVATGSVWTVTSQGSYREGPPSVSSSDDGIVSIEVSSEDSALLTAAAVGAVSIDWRDTDTSADSFSVEVRDPASVVFSSFYESALFGGTLEDDVFYGEIPEPPGDHLRIFEGNALGFGIDALLDADGAPLRYPDDMIRMDGQSVKSGLRLDPLSPSVFSLGAHPLPMPTIDSASIGEVASVEVLALSLLNMTYIELLAFDADGERIWAPEGEWEVVFDDESLVDEFYDEQQYGIVEWTGEAWEAEAVTGLDVTVTVGSASTAARLEVEVQPSE